jgi:hypothetical protein
MQAGLGGVHRCALIIDADNNLIIDADNKLLIALNVSSLEEDKHESLAEPQLFVAWICRAGWFSARGSQDWWGVE